MALPSEVPNSMNCCYIFHGACNRFGANNTIVNVIVIVVSYKHMQAKPHGDQKYNS